MEKQISEKLQDFSTLYFYHFCSSANKKNDKLFFYSFTHRFSANYESEAILGSKWLADFRTTLIQYERIIQGCVSQKHR